MPPLYLYEPIIRANANCLVAVISGCRAYNDEAIIKEFGSKEANPLKPINLTLTLEYCFINEQDLLGQLINVSGIIPRHLISDKAGREHRPSLCVG
ncbi:hypothetical protein HpCK14_11430 [Helicobacter pylori]|uniref:hypothetical protein n=1 Tax=Helicobacter pylori TaxID=210 RepID=UPI001AA52E09|nr:hypothetical protein VN0212_14720 [Helicobacter pylori]GHQ76058.1 hypothetical protein VN1235_09790 [Helicobacter pylori]GHR63108.1 hypothetical protein VN0559_12090 [Helicobacter pylori]GHS44232.1 hypothetical protein VN1163_12020 [Helicobacter pylori]